MHTIKRLVVMTLVSSLATATMASHPVVGPILATSAVGQGLNGGNFNLNGARPVPPAADPFALRNQGQPAQSSQNAPPLKLLEPSPLLPSEAGERTARLPSPATPASSSIGESNAASRGDGKMLLHDARLALANRDVRSATQLVENAKQSGASFALLGDSPEKVEMLLRRSQQFAAGPQGGNQDAFKRDFAQFLMEQADGLLSYQNYDAAQRLAVEAKNVRANFGPFDRTPENLLTKIEGARRQIAPNDFTPETVRNSARPVGANDFQLPSSGRKAEAQRLVATALRELDRGNLDGARQLAEQAVALKVPDNEFAQNETRPWEVELRVSQAINQRGGVATAGYTPGNEQFPVSRGVFQPDNDFTRNSPATFQDNPTSPRRLPATGDASEGRRLYEQGMRAYEQLDNETALEYFRQAWQHAGALDPNTRQLLQDKLNQLQAPPAEPIGPGAPSPLNELERDKYMAMQRVQQEVFRERAAAERMKPTDPLGALERLKALRDRVSRDPEVDGQAKGQMVATIERSIGDMERYIEENRAQIENDQINQARLQDVAQRRHDRVADQEAVAALVEQFNKLLDERRFAEAEAIARQAHDLGPELPVVQTMLWKSRFAKRLHEQMMIADRAEAGFVDAMTAVDESKIPFDDRFPIQYGPVTEWTQLSRRRSELMREMSTRLSPREIQMDQTLRTERVSPRFVNRPLREVLELLGRQAGLNFHIHEEGLHAEGVTSDRPVTLNLPNDEISLRSALNILLSDLHLTYIIQDEVVKITSEQMKDRNVYAKTYYVADLVIPIPNFLPSYNIGLPGAIAASYNALGYGHQARASGTVPLTIAANPDATNPVTNNPQVLANLGADGMMGAARASSAHPLGYGPGGAGGGATADFDSLIELITTTIAPQTWDNVGGSGSVASFDTNLSLVISQTQDVHDQIAELLVQLRRLQDLQVTIEVRFISLADDFFERIGIDFDFDIDDNSGLTGDGMGGFSGTVPADDAGPSRVIGITAPDGVPTGDLDLSFTQDSFGSAVPAFGGFDAQTAANFGFAILSDIEVFFLIQASQGDNRSNIMQAPKVTLFNGQTAFVSDLSQRPFVTSIIPVVGDFAAAQQPVVVVLSEGSSLSVQAVVSSDRRYVRLTLVPFFSSIGDVQTFTYDGKQVTVSGDVQDPTDPSKTIKDATLVSREGSTVQLPTFAFTSVTTTVSVPDGGTVLLGGIKRLSEGRTERGVPLLNKLPYINRLFKNVGIGRTSSSLMMMVTPRIIIQEEEEINQTGVDSSQL